MKREISIFVAAFAVLALVPQAGRGQARQSGSTQPLRPVGVVSKVGQNQLTLHTDAGPNLQVRLAASTLVVQVPPGAKNLKSALKISPSEISVGDRILVQGIMSHDQESITAKSIIVMNKTALAAAHQKEEAEWREHGINGVVKALDPATKEITLAVPNSPPTPGNLTHPVTLKLAPAAELLRYAPDSVKFSDARPSTFSAIKVGDQVRALGTMSADGTHYLATKLVSGTFRNIAATVISVDPAKGTLKVNDLDTKKPILVRTNADSKMHTLPPWLATMIARFNSAGKAGGRGMAGPPNAERAEHRESEHYRPPSGNGRPSGMRRIPHDFSQILEHTPTLSLSELKPGEPLIVVSTEGTRPSEVTAIAVLGGVEPILQARPKGSSEVVLGPWNMGMGGGGSEGVTPQ